MDLSSVRISPLPQVDARWKMSDYLGALNVRFSINRNNYTVAPGLYKFGKPDSASDVLVTANYKLSFDVLRKNLSGLSAWILVLDTKGINVWCAAGKGTFGTQELIRRIKESNLRQYIDHNRIILPQLGAPGVAAHEVNAATGFKVKFGPVRASDIPAYLHSGYKKDEAMREVTFTFRDRFILAPVELANHLKYLALALLGFVIVSLFTRHGFADNGTISRMVEAAVYIFSAYIAGAFLGPVMLPWLPFRSFGSKGLIVGAAVFLFVTLLFFPDINFIRLIAFLLLSMGVASFLTMNFTGASTYTSLSGVRKEMKIFVPVQLSLAFLGIAGIILSQLL